MGGRFVSTGTDLAFLIGECGKRVKQVQGHQVVKQGACDCHVHVFGPAARYPFSPERAYTPPDARRAARRAARSLGLERVVIVQPSPYGTDNSLHSGAAKRLGRCARAVVVVDETQRPRCEMHRGGARGMRVNLYTAGQNDPAAALRALHEAARGRNALGWHVQVFTTMALIEQLESALPDLPVPLVVDHFGLPQDRRDRPAAASCAARQGVREALGDASLPGRPGADRARAR